MASTIRSSGALLNGFTNSASSPFTDNKNHLPISFVSFPQFSRPNFKLKSSRLRILQRRTPSTQLFGVPIVYCLSKDDSDVYPESDESFVPIDSHKCSGCFQHHKLVDNLGLVVEYDFRDEIDAD
ncbi:hypothetical protein ACH5RR_036069 [Cinchona calisaya]|uniref:Uncharacterized protein n=1 Tax=Cinchona calisaya TaxID=153742 RepID=A0ABD2Y479_9GENT